MKNYKKLYRDLEMSVLNELRELIEKTKTNSKFGDFKALKIDFDRYVEIVILNDSLTLIDHSGNYYNIFVVSLEELIDLLYLNKKK